ncbi:MAG: putative DNA-binding transcriptional regulator YafY [Psychroserpens sp.]|jgi:predicted DNA-binding transcriptional regulator YafY
MSTSTTLRHLEMLRKIPVSPGMPITTTELHQHLIDEGFEVSKRTVERDLLKLSEIGGLYLNESAQGNTWGNIGGAHSNKLAMQPSEALMLVLSEKLLLHTMPIEYAQRIGARIENAKVLLSAGNALGKWQDKLQVISDGYPLINNSLLDDDTREIIYECVLKECQINIRYQARDKDTPRNYCLNPLGIIIRGQSHYLVATKTTSPEKPLLFLFHRIKSADSNYKKMDMPSSFTMADYYAKNPSGWILKKESQIETIKLNVKGYALDTLLNNKLAKDQKLEHFADGWAKVQFSCVPTYDLVAWMLRYGADVICESPAHLKRKMTKVLSHALEQYQD